MARSNYQPIRLACYSLVLLTASVLAVASPAYAEAQKNVVILLADDLGWGDVGFHGGSAQTPNIDGLAAEGVQLNRFYAYPSCSPARAALLTGRFPHRYGIVDPVRPRDEGLPASEVLLPSAFGKAGYETSLIGKWHLGVAGDNANPSQRGFDQFYGFMDASVDYYKHTGLRGQLDWQRNGKTINEEGYSTDLLANEAVRQINARDKRKPFCMVVSFNAPHSPFQAPEALIAKYRGRLNERAATYAAMIDSLDQGIGRILGEIDQQNLRNDTIIVFTSDNGAVRIGNNAPFRGLKRDVYDGGIHVPCVIRAPGLLKAGTENEQLSAIHDLFPTLAEAAGVAITPSKPLDGTSLWSRLVSGKPASRTIVIAENDHAIIRDDWKLIQLDEGNTELYNLQSDRSEAKNLAQTEAKTASQLLSKLAQYKVVVKTDGPATDVFETFVADRDTTKVLTASPTGNLQEGESLARATLRGDVKYGVLGDPRTESNGRGVRLLSGEDSDGNGTFAGEASLTSTEVSPDQRWYRFYVSGLAQDNFAVEQDELYLKVEFFQKNGSDSLDLIKERIYPQVMQERKDFFDKDTNESLGHGMWRTYAMDFRTPFPEVDTVKLSVGFAGGKGELKRSEFWVNSMDLESIDTPKKYLATKPNIRNFPQPDAKTLVALGGRWYYDPQGGSKQVPKQFDYTNSDQLLYKSGRFEAPFAGNMSSWLRAGYKDFDGELVDKDQYKPYAVVIMVEKDHIVMRSRNLPNHPTATFPDKWRMLDGNPSYIQEKANTWYLPKYPKLAKDPIAMDAKNANGALPMGPIGVATNGVIFFNPFDHIFETDAVWRLDRCCGHPSPQSAYHYHKYPVCVKTPWSDEGKMHSSVIGFAFDGLPVYGPYEADGLLAKDDKSNPLNDFNLHTDKERGPHYHVTPGKFPHIIGGYFGEVDPMNGRGRRER
ncbi:Arylsulfatase A [Neorhodopirellula lusitana]|uniref:Arylsulfatase A n=1 Tax=Neorhodopirellula lusitana TaxID=445327 RepID=A0ABY1QHW4_9BACT|nr:sulfatase-like hydrolase/transferase [Neorhodopirellula lusitana]SMP71334.1 Arylsulfatase A [Neorhodopirellula lusitana]